MRIFLSTFVIFALSACFGSTNKPPINDDPQKRSEYESEIYSTLLGSDTATYIILDKTLSTGNYLNITDEDLLKNIPLISIDTLNNFRQVNQKVNEIPIPLDNPKYQLVSQSDLDLLIDEYDHWEKFYQKYPNEGYYYFFSRIGFNSELNQALVYMGYRCGFECGSGEIYFLVRDENKWVVAGSCEVWVS
jgi:hypothetical protein